MLSLSRVREMLARFDVEPLRPVEDEECETVSPGKYLPRAGAGDAATVAARYGRAGLGSEVRDCLLDAWTVANLKAHATATEHCLGTVKVPLGVAGPLLLRGQAMRGSCFVPLATTEAALVASVDRGLRAIGDAGGAKALVVSQGVQRAPAFVFESVSDAANFVAFAAAHEPELRAAADATTRFGRVIEMQAVLEGNCAWLVLTLDPADASGQNMVTFAARAMVAKLLELSPLRPRAVYEEGNLSGDKKPSHVTFLANRGRKACAEVLLPGAIVQRRFRASAAAVVDAWRVLAMGSVHSGTIGIQGHYANVLAALFLATGQDVACVAESSVGVTRFELREGEDGVDDLYASVSLPGLMVGTIGGGTSLPSQRACLAIMGLDEPAETPGFGAMALAEIAVATCLGGELSIIGALAAGDFGDAHQRLARGRK